MNTAIIYHWWTTSVKSVEDDKFNPIIFSIACVRNYNNSIPIHVINLSPWVDWSSYPEMLNFKVINKISRFPDSNYYQANLMSRVLDITEYAKIIPEDNIIFNDVDVFWIKDPLPLINDTNLFNCNRNNGVFYYNKNERQASDFVFVWCQHIKMAVENAAFRNRILLDFGFSLDFKIHDELVIRYTQSICDYLYKSVPLIENNIIFTPIINPKNIHIIRAFVGKKDRLKIAMSIFEINQAVQNVLGNVPVLATEIFTVSDLLTKRAIEAICLDGNPERAINHLISKIC